MATIERNLQAFLDGLHADEMQCIGINLDGSTMYRANWPAIESGTRWDSWLLIRLYQDGSYSVAIQTQGGDPVAQMAELKAMAAASVACYTPKGR